MSRLVYYIGIVVAASVLVPLAFAQSFTFNPPPSQKTTVPTPPYSVEPQPVITPDNFKSGVQDANKEIQTKLDQQVSQSLKPVPVPAPKAPPPPKEEETTSTTQGTQTKTPQKIIKPRQETLPVQQAAPPVNTPPPVTPNQQAIAPPPPVSQPQPYTGFGTQTPPSTNGQTPPSNNELNIRY